jgi:hypothetical protein
MAAIREWLEPLGIHTIGRFGGWDYVNSDACIRHGREVRLTRVKGLTCGVGGLVIPTGF